MKRILAVVLLALSLSVALGFTAERAEALNPNQTTVVGTVNAVYWDIDKFWGLTTYDPAVGYYNYVSNGQVVHFNTICGPTSSNVGTQGFYCNGGHIQLDWTQQTGNLSTYGDGAVAFWLAHEYAHHAEWSLGISWTQPYHELLADCFAGQYFRYGVNTSRKLLYNDYLEARNQIWALATSSASHGGKLQRLRAFDYGYNSAIGYTNCTNGWRNW
jgi:predicted metalloprotease